VDRITPDGQISRVIDMSVQFPGTIPPNDWVGPTGIAYLGNFYVGTLGQFPVTPGTQSIYKVTPSGQLEVAASGLTAVLGVAFDHEGRMYALEGDTTPGFPGPGAAFSGAVVRVNGDGSLTTMASGLMFPTAMTLGPDDNLYVSNFGFGVPVPGIGQVVRIDLAPPPDTLLHPAERSASAGLSTVLTAAPANLTSVPVSPAEASGGAVGGAGGNDWVISMAQTPAVLPAAASPALQLPAAAPAEPPLTRNRPPSARYADPSEAAADQVFANLDAELSLALFGDGLAVPPRN
jgi:hypothetical protein